VAKWSKSLSSVIDSFVGQVTDNGIDAFEKTAIDISTNIIEQSPLGIPDAEGGSRGNFKGNWKIQRKENSRYFKTVRKPDLGRGFAETKIRGRFSRTKSSRLVLFNNSPQARVIEFGGYPSPVKKGTYRRGRGYERRSSGGFSNQAPRGLVRINSKRFGSLFRKHYVNSR
tara:strand:+ start:217 stop:726 length:510 start_codon:yes stop_codon:yes gene_type:complete